MRFMIPFKIPFLPVPSSEETYSLRGRDKNGSFFLGSPVQGHKLKYLWRPWITEKLEKAPKGRSPLHPSPHGGAATA